ncbi:uncharacterized membrane-anchored protein YjiN (DUF445 family) [Sphingomonas kaistensis]|uniref:Uncharacterized membrane-anchored protein YjiN (DUF445 family) n=1 Tax=Sphingomonas kaistensis TaxID=298708 RepID=A0A7X5Y7E4_9SPHN|nr:DUF445 domain-containing protein [Sphingomonas kaistensis]NJC05260.1 uncharacterized membrane-anchored protein YjiN (DUF445 family) [Sphingomonas kaistensis]
MVALSRFNPVQPGAQGMKVVATGLLVVMAAIFVVTRALEPRYPWLGLVKAFAEAAMVGGLADWFAVTALFRHPLGLPIPHTAIIPRNKDRIGLTLANFIRDNFLVARVVARRMRGIDVAAAAGRFLRAPSGEGTRIRRGASRLIADLFESLDDERLGGIVKGAISQRLAKTEVSPLLGAALASAIEDNRHVPMLEAAIRALSRALDANESLIRDMVKRRASWVLRLAALDEKLADAIVDGLRKLTVEVSADPDHPMRGKMVEALSSLAHDLQHKPETRARVEQWKEELLANRSVAQWLDRLWQKGRASIIAAARNPDAALAGRMGEVLRSAGSTLEGDPRIRRAVNQFVRRAAAGMAASYGGSIVSLVSDTIRGWDARTVTERLESAVGRDLQYIRINGTLVGGFVGLVLHFLDTL